MRARASVGVRYEVPRRRDGWELSEETMPESVTHDRAVELLKALLAAWAARAVPSAFVARNLAVRWDEERPRVGVDPDVCIVSPPPPAVDTLRSLRTWVDGHTAPALAVEVVSEADPRKDYVSAPDKYAACGVRELWVFDPLLAGPSSQGGPFRLQVWSRTDSGDFIRVYAGEGPARSDVVGAFLVPMEGGRVLRLADDATAQRLWPTAEEAALAREEQERRDKEAALARVAELEAHLSRERSSE